MWNRLNKNLIAIISGQIVLVAGNLLLVSLYLAYWPATIYGEWLAMFSLVSSLSTFDLGINMAVVNRLTQAYTRGSLEEYSRVQHSATVFYLALAGIGSLLLAVLAWHAPIPTWLGLKETPPEEAAWVVWWLGLVVLWAMPGGLVTSVYRTTGNLAKSQWIGNAQQIVTLAVIALVLLIGGGMNSVAAWQLAPMTIATLCVMWDLRRCLPPLVPKVTQASLSVLRELVKPSFMFMLIMLAMAIAQQGSVLVISSALGGVAVATFVTLRSLTNLIQRVVRTLSNALWPDLTTIEARGEQARLRVVHRMLVGASTTICIALAAALWHEGSEVIAIWTRGKLDPDLALMRLLLVHLVLQSPWLASSYLTIATNRHPKLAWSYLLSALIGVGVAALLVKWMGTGAVPVGLMVGEALACYHFVVRDTCRMIGEPYGPFAWRLWLGIAVVAASALMVGWVGHETIPGPAFIRWVGVGVFTSAVSASAAWGIWLTTEDRAILLPRLRPLAALASGKAWSIRW